MKLEWWPYEYDEHGRTASYVYDEDGNIVAVVRLVES